MRRSAWQTYFRFPKHPSSRTEFGHDPVGIGYLRTGPPEEARMSIAQIKPISYLTSHVAQELAAE